MRILLCEFMHAVLFKTPARVRRIVEWLTPLFRRPLQAVEWTVWGLGPIGVGRIGDWRLEGSVQVPRSLFPGACSSCFGPGPKQEEQGAGNREQRTKGSVDPITGTLGPQP